MIPGVVVRELQTLPDERGSFAETFRQAWLPEGSPPMIQSNLSRSRAGVLRGMHFHLRQSDWWIVLEGSAFVALHDLRDDPRADRGTTMTVDASEGLVGIYIPPRVAHGFLALTEVALQYLVDAGFDGSDEFGFAWDDPQAGIGWPAADPPLLSARDLANPPLAEALALARRMG